MNDKLMVCEGIHIDKIYVINLESEVKLRNDITQHLTKLKVMEYATFINAVNMPSDPMMGCLRSHKKAVQDAVNNNYDCIMILEDDCVFTEFPFKISDVVPDDWKMIYPGYLVWSHRSFKYNKSFLKLIDARSTHCYIIKRDMYKLILELTEQRNLAIDMSYISKIQQKYPCYGIYPIKAHQRPHPSTLSMKGRVVDWKPIMDQKANICYKQTEAQPPNNKPKKTKQSRVIPVSTRK